MPTEQLRARSLQEFITIVSKTVQDWSDAEKGESRLWYRGQSNAAWGLTPGQYRYSDLDEQEVRSEFQLKARPLLRDVPTSEWEWYFIMQHHGLPTRLLDWTTGALLGLYFALRDNTGSEDAAVWVLDPWALNKFSTRKSDLLMHSDFSLRRYLPALYGATKLPQLPVAVVPPYNSERITVQRGTFTVHGKKKSGLETMFRRRLAKITIPKENSVRVRRQLRVSGIGEFTVFPDLDGLCREICANEIYGC